MGATNPTTAAPGTIRGDLALAMPDNLVHGSDRRSRSARSRFSSRMELPEYARLNRDVWTATNAEYTDAAAREAWAREEVMWSFQRPESEVGVLGDVDGVIDLGCGCVRVGVVRSAWRAAGRRRRDARSARDGAPVAGRDGVGVPSGGGESAEDVPLPVRASTWPCQYGASIWCDPKLWVAEAARLLRPGGRLIFVCNSPLSIVCSPDEGRSKSGCSGRSSGCTGSTGPVTARASAFTSRTASGSASWANGFDVERLVELQAPADARDHEYYDFVAAEWAKRWPAEDLWVARKPA